MTSPRTLLGLTQSTCRECLALIPAKIFAQDGDVWFDKFCPTHGSEQVRVRADEAGYPDTLRHVKPASVPRVSHSAGGTGCPDACGFCADHEQHLCLPIVEITEACDLACPICLVDAGGRSRLSRGEFAAMLDRLIEAEPQIDVLNLSGGEPLLHPQLVALIDEALSRPAVVRVSVSTNGLSLLDSPELVAELAQRRVVVALQFDGFDDGVYRALRGRPLLREKQQILQLLTDADITTSLIMTAARGVNEDAFGPLLELLFDTPNIVGLMVQPLAYTGRAARLESRSARLTLPEVIAGLAATGRLEARDLVPLPCSHPACFSLGFFLMTDDLGPVSLARVFDAERSMDLLANRGLFGLDGESQELIQSLVYDLWSGPAACDPTAASVLRTVRQLLGTIRPSPDGGFDPRRAFDVGERRVKSIFVHAFQDADTFDLSRVRRCCNGYPQADGSVLPVCVRNVRRQPGAQSPATKSPSAS